VGISAWRFDFLLNASNAFRVENFTKVTSENIPDPAFIKYRGASGLLLNSDKRPNGIKVFFMVCKWRGVRTLAGLGF